MIETLQSIASAAHSFFGAVRAEAIGLVLIVGFVLFVRYAAARAGKE